MNALKTTPFRRWIAAGLTAISMIAAGSAMPRPAAAQTPAPPQISVALNIMSIFQNGNFDPAHAPAYFIASQDAQGNFRTSDGSLTGQVTAVKNSLGVVTGHRISMVRRVSLSVTEVFSGSIQRVNATDLYLAGTYERRSRQLVGFIVVTTTTGPFPFHGLAHPIGG